MSTFSSYSLDDVAALRHRIDRDLHGRPHLQDASQRLADTLFDEFTDSAVLFRVFATVPFEKLPPKDRSFVTAIARERDCLEELQEQTTVVSLLGTRGTRPDWNARTQSAHHLGIPLTSTSFIQTIPMVSRLMSDMGTGLGWVEKQRTNIVVRSLGRMARILYVEDAATALTGDGFKVVPDQDFVTANSVRTVVGLAGAYLNRTIVTILLFTSEHIPQERIEKFMPIVNSFKTATMKPVMGGRFFE